MQRKSVDVLARGVGGEDDRFGILRRIEEEREILCGL
jgi:hypothetical protein